MISNLKTRGRRSKSLLIAFTIYKNWRTKRRFERGQITSFHGSSHSGKTLDASVAYIEQQFADYLQYGSLTPADIEGKRVLELGFGDNLGVALKFIAAGAAQVVCLDKFSSARDETYEREIYRRLRASMNAAEGERFERAIDLTEGIALRSECLKRITGIPLERAIRDLVELKTPFDLAISRAVIEEIYDPREVFEVIDRALVPGGAMLHKIDLSDYGMFRENGMHPLTFLTISDPVYRWMASDSGIPNRKRSGYYRKLLEGLGYSSRVFVTAILGRGEIIPHRESLTLHEDYDEETLRLIGEIRAALDNSFQDLSDDELMVEGIFISARKPKA